LKHPNVELDSRMIGGPRSLSFGKAETARVGRVNAPPDPDPMASDPVGLLCPHCQSVDLLALGRVFASRAGVRGLYRCGRCTMETWLRTPDRRHGTPDRRAS
jgi:hypothetical protein